MDMKINASRIVEYRTEKAWSQQHLADVSGLSLRTVQRIENTSSGSPDSIKAIAMAFGLIPADLMETAKASGSVEEPVSQVEKSPVPASKKKSLLTFGSITAALALAASVWFLGGHQLYANQSGTSSVTLSPVETEQQKVVAEAAHTWMKLVDEGDYVLSYDESDPLVHTQVTSDQWHQAVEQARTPLGGVLKREISSLTLSTSLPGLPDGEYAMVLFSSQFEVKSEAVETLPMSKASGEWRPIGYFIR